MEKITTIYEPICIEDENGRKWLLQDPNTTRYLAGEIIGYKKTDDNYIFIILTGIPYESNISYNSANKDYNKLIKYDYKNNKFSNDVKPEDLTELAILTDDEIKKIKKIRNGKPKEYRFEKNATISTQ